MILTLIGSNIAIQNVCDCVNPPQRSIVRLVHCCGYGAESSWHKKTVQVQNIFLLFYLLCQGASCGGKEQPGYLNHIQPRNQGSAALHSAVVCPVVFAWE